MTPFDEPIYVTAPAAAAARGGAPRGWPTSGRQAGSPTTAGSRSCSRRALRDYLGVPQLSLFNNGTIALLHGAARPRPARRGHHDAVHVPGDAARARLERRDAGLCGHRPGDGSRSIRPASKRPSPRGPRVSSACTSTGFPCDVDGLQTGGRSPRPEADLRRRARVWHDGRRRRHRHVRRHLRCSAFTPPSCFTRPKAARSRVETRRCASGSTS